ncbi:MAG TPA: sugar kinase [Puia sp.]|nr:sugar kinase [Puia sp.]
MSSFRLAAFGEFLLRLHSAGSKRFLQAGDLHPYFGGAEANVCVLLSRLGASANYITCIPENDLSVAGVQQLRSYGVGVNDIIYNGDKLGLYFTEAGNHMRPSRVIYDRAFSSFSFLKPGTINWKKIFNAVEYFHWSGISPAVSQGAADACLEAITEAKAKGVAISSDFNYRSTLWKYGKHPREIMPVLLKHTEIAVADLDSAHVYFGIETDKAASYEERFRQCCDGLRQKLPHLKTLAMSFRQTKGVMHSYCGALMQNGKYYFSVTHELPFITDQIGSGDAFTGGVLFGLLNKFEPQRVIDFAIACGSLKQSIVGDWAIINRDEVEQFIQNGPSGRIIR